MRRALAVPVLAAAIAGSASGCSSDATATIVQPTCSAGAQGSPGNGVILMAQSVPSAAWVPCMRTALPIGWSFDFLEARNTGAHFYLDSDRDGQHAIEVRLDRSCNTTGATEIPSDRTGQRRLERVTMTSPHFEGERYYVFDGGCISMVFRLTGQSRGEPLALATDSVGAVSRAEVQKRVHDESNGRLQLDPVSDGNG